MLIEAIQMLQLYMYLTIDKEQIQVYFPKYQTMHLNRLIQLYPLAGLRIELNVFPKAIFPLFSFMFAYERG